MKKFLSAALALTMTCSVLASCSAGKTEAQPQTVNSTPAANLAAVTETVKAPKYVFLFIGDGMSYPQFQSVSDYLGAMADSDYMQAEPSLDDNQGAVLDGSVALNFMGFEAAGSAVTYDSNSFAPDSASTATSIATGYKTYSGSINVDETATKTYETITEKVHDQLGMKVGVISSVNLNHATPAAFYAHQASRSSYYDIGLELIDSGFEYFAGGGLKKVTGPDKDKTSLYDLAEAAGYKVTYTQAEAEAITAADQKVILIDEHLADSDAMDYDMDRGDGEWALADYVAKGIEVLNNDTGFFMMCEGGKIDWACHANDAGATVSDTLALADAVQVAVDFAKEHADETLFGLKLTGAEDDRLGLTEYEVQRLRTAYDLAMSDYNTADYTQEQYVLYGGYNPFSVTVTHILNNKAGVDFTSYSHTGLPVAVFADGVGAEEFGGYYDNTDIYNKLANLLEVK